MSGDPTSGSLRVSVGGLDAADEQADHAPAINGDGPLGSPERAEAADSGHPDPCQPTGYCRYKTPIVRTAGILLLIAAAPVILLLMALVRLTSPGPSIFRQSRIGKNGQVFNMLKLRTMYDRAEELTGPVWCQRNDSRITPLGRVLRHVHLDELPQLWNVARGDMDLVGPRPERPYFVKKLIRRVPGYAQRHVVRPGVTGLAQVNLPPDESIDCVHRKLALDTEYIATASLALDLRILACTALRMCGLRHGRAVRLLQLERAIPKGERPLGERIADRTEAIGAVNRTNSQSASAGTSARQEGRTSVAISALRNGHPRRPK